MSGVAITGASTVISGAVTPTGDKDIFKMTLAADGVVRMEVFDSSGADCTSANVPASMKLSLLNSAGTLIVADTVTSGIGNCPELMYNMTAGTYYVQVEKTASGTIAAYKLEVKIQTTKGNETETNDTVAASNGLPSSDVYIFGGHQVAADKDVFAINVPAGKSVRAEIIEGSGAETCESLGIDSKIFLVNAAGTDLGSDDDSGRGYCSQIDGTGASPLHSYAHNLAAGTYYVRVEASGLCSGAGCQFDYRLAVTIR
jgi:hypothetical protein